MKQLDIGDSITIRRKVYQHLREKILSGAFGPDERLIETKIAREIGTSRTPVREALHSLELEKLIRAIPRVGYVVSGMSEEELEQICEIRALIEGLAMRWAMARSPVKLVKHLRKNVADQEESLAKGNAAAYVELDARFHEIVASLSGSERLLELAQSLRRHMWRYRIQCVHVTETALRSMTGHRAILAAVEQGNEAGASEAIRAHLEQGKKDILQYVFREGRNGSEM